MLGRNQQGSLDRFKTSDDMPLTQTASLKRDPLLQILGAFTCGLLLDRTVHQGRLYISNEFILFNSSPGVNSIRARMLTREIIAMVPKQWEGIPVGVDVIGNAMVLHIVNVAQRNDLIKLVAPMLSRTEAESRIERVSYVLPSDLIDLDVSLSVQTFETIPRIIFEFFIEERLGLLKCRSSNPVELKRVPWKCGSGASICTRRLVIYCGAFSANGKEELVTMRQSIQARSSDRIIVDSTMHPSFGKADPIAIRWIINREKYQSFTNLRVSVRRSGSTRSEVLACLSKQIAQLGKEFLDKKDLPEDDLAMASLAILPVCTWATLWYGTGMHEHWLELSSFVTSPTARLVMEHKEQVAMLAIVLLVTQVIKAMIPAAKHASQSVEAVLERQQKATRNAESEAFRQVWLLRKYFYEDLEQ